MRSASVLPGTFGAEFGFIYDALLLLFRLGKFDTYQNNLYCIVSEKHSQVRHIAINHQSRNREGRPRYLWENLWVPSQGKIQSSDGLIETLGGDPKLANCSSKTASYLTCGFCW